MTKLDDNFTVFNLEEGDTVDDVINAFAEQLADDILAEEDEEEEDS